MTPRSAGHARTRSVGHIVERFPRGGCQVSVEEKLKELGVEIPTPTGPMANYVSAVRTGNLVFISGHGPRKADGSLVTGKVGRDITVEQGYEAARLTMIQCLASLKKEIGDLEKVVRVVKLLGMVNSPDDFGQQPQVINGASDLLVAIFGDNGRHARSAVSMASLPMGMSVEIEMIVEVS